MLARHRPALWEEQCLAHNRPAPGTQSARRPVVSFPTRAPGSFVRCHTCRPQKFDPTTRNPEEEGICTCDTVAPVDQRAADQPACAPPDLADSRRDLALMAEIVERMRASETAGLRAEPAIQGTHSRCRQKLASASRRVRHTSPWLASYQAGSVLDQAGHRL